MGYWSRSLNDAQGAYDTTYREFYAVMWAVLLLRRYVERTKFTMRTDHDFLN